jgi:zinc/manganese transport system permease protein
MNVAEFEFGILLPAFVAGLLVTATHVPLGIQVLNRGIVFIDLAIAQIAGCGVILANFLGMETQGVLVQLSALSAALGGALLLTWTEKRWPEVQEAIIGTVFVLAASGAILLLSAEGGHHGHQSSEHLKDLLVGQILWVSWSTVALVALVYAVLLALWFGVGLARLKRTGFYVVFACAVTASVQLVGLYLVFATLIVPALATRRIGRWRLAVSYALGAAGYAFGLVVSALTDWPSGPAIVWVMTTLAVIVFAFSPRRRRAEQKPAAAP